VHLTSRRTSLHLRDVPAAMIGRLDGRRPTLDLLLRGPFGSARVEAIIDTGFSNHLSVPDSLVARLGLSFYGSALVVDAGGHAQTVSGYIVEVEWVSGPVRCVAL